MGSCESLNAAINEVFSPREHSGYKNILYESNVGCFDVTAEVNIDLCVPYINVEYINVQSAMANNNNNDNNNKNNKVLGKPVNSASSATRGEE